MPREIYWTFTAQVSDGSTYQTSGALEDVEGIEDIKVVVTAGGKAKVNVQPADGGRFTMIWASDYELITYQVLDAGGAAVGKPDPKTLDGPHILIGPGAVALLEGADGSIEFSNGGAEDVTIYVVVGRDATA